MRASSFHRGRCRTGQTDADRAALEFSIEHRIPHGGWCPKGKLAEDGPIDLRYQLNETPTLCLRQFM
jgi:Circularly permutated YpsA SLOG family